MELDSSSLPPIELVGSGPLYPMPTAEPAAVTRWLNMIRFGVLVYLPLTLASVVYTVGWILGWFPLAETVEQVLIGVFSFAWCLSAWLVVSPEPEKFRADRLMRWSVRASIAAMTIFTCSKYLLGSYGEFQDRLAEWQATRAWQMAEVSLFALVAFLQYSYFTNLSQRLGDNLLHKSFHILKWTMWAVLFLSLIGGVCGVLLSAENSEDTGLQNTYEEQILRYIQGGVVLLLSLWTTWLVMRLYRKVKAAAVRFKAIAQKPQAG